MAEKSLQNLNPELLPSKSTENIVPNVQTENVCKMQEQEPDEINDAKSCKEGQDAEENQSSSKRQWTMDEDDLVYRLHNQYGNKWAIIAEHLKGRSDNCIKNHFYSRLRKGLRKLNKIIEDSYQREFKEFKIIDLYKVIQASDEKFKEINSYPNEMTDVGHDLKNRLFIFAEQEPDGTEEFNIKARKLLDDMNDFTKNYKRKSKKSRRYSPMGVGSVYRNNKKQSQHGETEQQENQKSQKDTLQKEKVKSEVIVKIEQDIQKRQKKIRPKKQIQKSSEIKNQPTLVLPLAPIPPKKQIPILQQITEEPPMIRSKSRNTYRQFSDDQGEQKDDAEYQKQQRLNHFAENILKTFKSYYSFKSFKSNSAMDELFFP